MSKYKKDEALPAEMFIYTHLGPYIGTFLHENMGMTPNMITTLSNIIGALGIYFMSKQEYTIAVILFIIRQISDGLDGYVARKYKMTSDFGEKYDHLSDRVFGLAVAFLFIKQFLLKYNNDYKILFIISIPIIFALIFGGSIFLNWAHV